MEKIKYIIVCALVIVASCSSIGNDKVTYKEHRDFVPDEETAIKIAEAIWLPIYGERIYEKMPFKAKLENGIWIVKGTLPEGYLGGTPYIELQKYDCKVLKVIHGK